MKVKDLQGKLVAVLGYGQEGVAVCSYLLKHGIKPTLFDEKPWDQWDKEQQNQIKTLNINFIFGPDAFLELRGFDIGFRSPGINLKKIKDKGLKLLTSQAKFFFNNCSCKTIGVTGTKGKGTTCALLFEMLNNSRKKSSGPKDHVYLTGNIGYQQPLEILDELSGSDLVIYELSSFQLEDLEQSPQMAGILMVTSEHLDVHGSAENYWQAKMPIARYQKEMDYCIYNSGYEVSSRIASQSAGIKIPVSTRAVLKKGCYILNEVAVFDFPGFAKTAYGLKNILLRGRHNLENVVMAIALATVCGADLHSIQKALNSFVGLPYRLELIVEKNGIKFYNDSFSTTPETAIAALESFSQPEIVILGGSSKNSDFGELGQAILAAKNVKALILIGQEAQKIKAQVPGFSGKIYQGAANMEEIFKQISSEAKPGEVVLLSPGCASFGMFKNYKDRGEQFKKLALAF